MIRLWGLRTCDSCRAALKTLGGAAEFVDIRASLDAPTLARWIEAVGSETLLNRSSATWRGLSEAERAGKPAALMLAHPALVKRPVIEAADRVLVGRDAAAQALALGDERP